MIAKKSIYSKAQETGNLSFQISQFLNFRILLAGSFFGARQATTQPRLGREKVTISIYSKAQETGNLSFQISQFLNFRILLEGSFFGALQATTQPRFGREKVMTSFRRAKPLKSVFSDISDFSISEFCLRAPFLEPSRPQRSPG